MDAGRESEQADVRVGGSYRFEFGHEAAAEPMAFR